MSSKINILIADDELQNKEMLIDGLSQVISNFEVETVNNGADCINIIKSGYQPDLLFLDLEMPVLNGLDCLQYMHTQKLLNNAPVIIYSSSQNLKAIKAASGYGASFYLVTPASSYKLGALLQYIFKLLGLPRTEQKKKQNFVIAHEKLAKVLNYHVSM